MPTPSDLLAARIALQRGWAGEDAVRGALEAQRRARRLGDEVPLPLALRRGGALPDGQARALERELAVAAFLRAEQRWARALVERGLVAVEEARALVARARAEGYPARLADALVEQGRLAPAARDELGLEVARALAAEERRAEAEALAAALAGDALPAIAREDVPAAPVVAPAALEGLARDRWRIRADDGAEGGPDAPLPALEGLTVEARLGRGALGVVFQARGPDGRPLAVKVLSPTLTVSPAFVQAFKAGWAAARAVEDPGVVRLGKLGRSGELVFYTLDLAPGGALADRLAAAGPLDPGEVRELARALLETLGRLHAAGVVHGGLGPGGVLFGADDRPLLGDVGLANLPGAGLGTGDVCASSRVLEGGAAGPGDDLFALGATLWLALTGEPPFGHALDAVRRRLPADARALPAGVDPGLAEGLRALLSPLPADRPVDAAAALRLLAGRGAGGPPPSGATPRPPAPPAPPRAPTPPSGPGGLGGPRPLPPTPPPTPRNLVAVGAAGAPPGRPSPPVRLTGRMQRVEPGGRTAEIPIGTPPLPLPSLAAEPPLVERTLEMSAPEFRPPVAPAEEPPPAVERTLELAAPDFGAAPPAPPPASPPPGHVVARTVELAIAPEAPETFERTMELPAPSFDAATPAGAAEPAFERTMELPGAGALALVPPPSPGDAEPGIDRTIVLPGPPDAHGAGAAAPPWPAASSSGEVTPARPLDAPFPSPPPAPHPTERRTKLLGGRGRPAPVAPPVDDPMMKTLAFEGPPLPLPGAMTPAAGPGEPFDAMAQTLPIRAPDLGAGPPAPGGFDAMSVTAPIPAPVFPPPSDAMSATAPLPAPAFPRPGGGSAGRAAPIDLTGRLIHGRYRIVDKLGQGGMGVVYRAEHTLMGRPVAFKVLNPELVTSAESVARFKREIMAMAQFQHRNVVRIFDAGTTEEGQFYMAMELVEGVNLSELIHASGALPLDRFVNVFTQVLRGVGEGHKRGIVHRDLKSENILLTQEGGEEVVKIMDFGIAKLLGGEERPTSQSNAFLTTERVALGTPEYMSPEQASGVAHLDHRSDIYSLGVVAYEMVTGRLPFEADSPVGYIGKHIVDPPAPFAETAPGLGLPASLEAYVGKALEKDVDDRYQSAEAMLLALERALPAQVADLRRARPDRWPGGSAAVVTSGARAPVIPVDSDEGAQTMLAPPEGGMAAEVAAVRASLAGARQVAGAASDEPDAGAASAEPEGGAPARRTPWVALVIVAGLGLVALLVAGIAVAVALRGRADVGAALVERRGELDAALGGGRWADARAIVEPLAARAPADAEDPGRKAVAAALARIEAAEQAHGALGAARAAAEAAAGACRAAAERGDLPAAEAALGEHGAAVDAGGEAHERLGGLGLAGLAGAPPADERDALRVALAPLRELGEKVSLAERLLRVDPPDHDGAIAALERAVALARDAARRGELEQRLVRARAGRHEADARRELDRATPDLAAAARRLEEALALEATPARRELLERVAQRQREQAREVGLRELGRLGERFDAALAAGDLAGAEGALTQARRLAQERGLGEAGDLSRRGAALEAARRAAADRAALPPVPPAPAAGRAEDGAALARAADARRAWLDAHEGAPGRAEVEAELAALERRRGEGPAPGGTTPGGTTPGGTTPAGGEGVEALLARASEAWGRGALDEAAQRLDEADAAAQKAGAGADAVQRARVELRRRRDLAAALARCARVGALWIARFETTNLDYFRFTQARARSARGDADALARAHALCPEAWGAGRSFPSGQGELPVAGVSFRDAEAYCAWLSQQLGVKVRLPTEAEWVAAATGGDAARTYPWGAQWDERRVVYKGGALLATTAPSIGGESPAGLTHLAGSVAEWVDTPWNDPDLGPDASTRVLKGGSFRAFTPDALAVKAQVKGGLTQRQPDWGFRVVIEAPGP